MEVENGNLPGTPPKENRDRDEKGKSPMKDPDIVYGHRPCQSRDVKYLCLENIYQKFYRPNFYDIGGTYLGNIGDYWFTYKTEQVGHNFLLHLFVCNNNGRPFSLALSSSNELTIDKKRNIAYMSTTMKKYHIKVVRQLSQQYITTFSFKDLDIEFLEGNRLYISAKVPVPCDKELDTQILNDVKMNHDLGALLLDPVGSDFVIEAADGEKFQVHKVILAAHSEVFRAMLKEETAEAQNSCVKLVDVCVEDLRAMLEYIYTGSLSDHSAVNFISMFMLADRYNLRGLRELSQHALSAQLTIDNAIETLTLSDMYDSEWLKYAVLKFIKNNLDTLESPSYKELKNPELMRELCTYLVS